MGYFYQIKVFVWVILLVMARPAHGQSICDQSERQREILAGVTAGSDIFAWLAPLREQVALSAEFLVATGEVNENQILSLLCDPLGVGIETTFALSQADFLQQKRAFTGTLYAAVFQCSIPLRRALAKEGETCPASGHLRALDLERLDQFIATLPQGMELAKNGIDPEQPVKNFSDAQLKKLVDGDELQDIATGKPYYSLLALGMTLMPKYSPSGDNEGFKETSFFGLLKLDNRWGLSRRWTLQSGIDVAFYSAPVSACATGEQQNAEEDCAAQEVDVSSLKFTDISNTLNAAIYSHALVRIAGQWEVGPSGRYGVTSREKVTRSGDSVSRYFLLGAELVLNDFLDRNSYKNGLPRFSFNLGVGESEDFAGSGVASTRVVAVANYRVFDNQPVFVSLLVNGGEGPDTLALNLSYGFVASRIFNILVL